MRKVYKHSRQSDSSASDRHETKQQREGEIKAHRPDIFKNLKKIPHAESYFLRKSLLVNEVPLLFSFELSLSSFDFLANINAFFRSDDRAKEDTWKLTKKKPVHQPDVRKVLNWFYLLNF